MWLKSASIIGLLELSKTAEIHTVTAFGLLLLDKANRPNHRLYIFTEADKMAEETAVDTRSPLFHSTSKDKPSVLHISFESDPTGSLGCQLVNHDKVSEYGDDWRRHLARYLNSEMWAHLISPVVFWLSSIISKTGTPAVCQSSLVSKGSSRYPCRVAHAHMIFNPSNSF